MASISRKQANSFPLSDICIFFYKKMLYAVSTPCNPEGIAQPWPYDIKPQPCEFL